MRSITGRPRLRARPKAAMAPSIAPVQVIATPQMGPKIMPFAMARSSAGNGTKQCRIMRPIEAATPHGPAARIAASTASSEGATPANHNQAPTIAKTSAAAPASSATVALRRGVQPPACLGGVTLVGCSSMPPSAKRDQPHLDHGSPVCRPTAFMTAMTDQLGDRYPAVPKRHRPTSRTMTLQWIGRCGVHGIVCTA